MDGTGNRLGANGSVEPLVGQVVPPSGGDTAGNRYPVKSDKKKPSGLKGTTEPLSVEFGALIAVVHEGVIQGELGASDALLD